MHTISDILIANRAKRESLTRDIMLVLGGSMLVAVCAKIQIPGPLPLTMQTFGVVLVGAMLGSRRGALAMIAYLLEGAAGLPVFARPISGLGYFSGDTAGYLAGFVVAAFIVGLLAERGWDRRYASALAAFAIGHAMILAMGCAWRSLYVGPSIAVVEGVYAVKYTALLKICLAAAVLPTGWRIVQRPDRIEGHDN